jgi:hypothetical protein
MDDSPQKRGSKHLTSTPNETIKVTTAKWTTRPIKNEGRNKQRSYCSIIEKGTTAKWTARPIKNKGRNKRQDVPFIHRLRKLHQMDDSPYQQLIRVETKSKESFSQQ